MSNSKFAEFEQEKHNDNPYELKWQIEGLSLSDNVENTIGIKLSYREKKVTDDLKSDVKFVAQLIFKLKNVQDRLPTSPPMMQPNYNSKQYVQNIKEYYDTWIKEDESSKFDSSKIKGSVVLTRDFSNLGMGVSLPKDDVNNPSELMDYLLALLDKIRSEDEYSELSR